MNVNTPASSRRANVTDGFAACCLSERPIDRYYSEVVQARTLYAKVEAGTTLPEPLVTASDLGILREMIFLRCITAFEDYLKLMVGLCVSTLPCCQEKSLNEAVPLHAAFSYPKDRVGMGLVEGKSLSDSSDIIRRLGYLDVGTTPTVKAMFADLDPVLQLRHCLVHGLGILSAHDSVKVKAREKVGQRVNISHHLLADCMEVIDRAVRVLNQHTFDTIEQRWWLKRFLTGQYQKDKDLFALLIGVFWSERDQGVKLLNALYRRSKAEWFPRVGQVLN